MASNDVYVSEIFNERVQTLTANGVFVSMLGGDVNASGSASQAQRDLCIAKSHDRCRAGREGDGVGELDGPESVAFEAASGDVYVLEVGDTDSRLDKYAGSGRFLWRAGGRVGPRGRGALCTAADVERGARCGPGVIALGDVAASRGQFKFPNQSGDLLAVDERRGLIYAGDEHSVQVLATDGHRRAAIQLTSVSDQPGSSVVALALDRRGYLYVVYRVGNVENFLPSEQANVIRKFSPSGYQVAQYVLKPKYPAAVESINAMAVDDLDQMAVMGVEDGGPAARRFGTLLDLPAGRIDGEFSAPPDNDGIAFDGEARLFVATAVDQSVAVYSPTPSLAPFDLHSCAQESETGDALAPECALSDGDRYTEEP
jgi:hypothetical protein